MKERVERNGLWMKCGVRSYVIEANDSFYESHGSFNQMAFGFPTTHILRQLLEKPQLTAHFPKAAT
jgi:hypothetical protein